ncbi:MAG: hypothetical protein ABI729_07490 [Chitinophagales bacterium]
MKKLAIASLMLMSIMTFTNCSQRLVDFTVISSKNFELVIDKTLGKQVKGTSMGFLGIGASIKDAMDEALQSAGPDYDILIDGVVRINGYVFVSGYKVEGTAMRSNHLKATLGQKGFESWCKANDVFDPNTAIVIQN